MKKTTENFTHPRKREHHYIRSFFSAVYGLDDYVAIKNKLGELFLDDECLDYIEELFDAIQEKDSYTLEHSLGVAKIAIAISKELGLDENEQFLVGISGFVHDIGKIYISESILQKKDELTPEEWKMIRRHPVYTRIILSELKNSSWQRNITVPASEHHETPDGMGYPNGLKNEEIHIYASIIKVADAFEALISERPYRKAFPPEESLKIIKDGMGTQFNRKATEALLNIYKNGKVIKF